MVPKTLLTIITIYYSIQVKLTNNMCLTNLICLFPTPSNLVLMTRSPFLHFKIASLSLDYFSYLDSQQDFGNCFLIYKINKI